MVLTSLEELIGLPQYKIIDLTRVAGEMHIVAEDTAHTICPHCGIVSRNKGVLKRRVRHAAGRDACGSCWPA